MDATKAFAGMLWSSKDKVREDLSEEDMEQIRSIANRWHKNMVDRLSAKRQPIPEYGDHMPLSEFVETCKSMCFIDYDGHGKYATATEMSEVIAIPSHVVEGIIVDSFTHVVWFNK